MAETKRITQKNVLVNREKQFQYDAYFQLSEMGFVIPGLHQDLVPQGFTYLKEKDWFIISYYRESDNPSVITIVDVKTNRLVKTLHLNNVDGTPYTEHAGGVTVSNKYLFVSSSHKLYYMPLEKVYNAATESAVSFEDFIPTEVRGSFTKVNEGILWVGEFAFSGAYETRENHHMKNRSNVTHQGWITGYQLDQNTGLIPTDKPKNGDGVYVPDYILSISYRIQGMAVSDEKIVLSQSYGRTADSHLYIYKNPLEEEPHTYVDFADHYVPLWFLDGVNQTKTMVLPPMSESLARKGDNLYVLYESGADLYVHDCSYPQDRVGVLQFSTIDKGESSNSTNNFVSKVKTQQFGKQIVNNFKMPC